MGFKPKDFSIFSFRKKIFLAICLLSVSITSSGLYYFYSKSYQMTFELLQRDLRNVGNVGTLLFGNEERKVLKRLIKAAVSEAKYDAAILASIPVGSTYQSISSEKVKKLHSSEDYLKIQTILKKIAYATYKEAQPIPAQYEVELRKGLELGMMSPYLQVNLHDKSDEFGMYVATIGNDPSADNWWPGNPIGNVFHSFGLMSLLENGTYLHPEPFTDVFYTSVSGYVPIYDEKGEVLATLGLDYSVGGQFEKLNTMKRVCFLLISLSILFSVLFAFLASKSLSHPLKQLYSAAMRVSQDDYSATVEIKSRDEFGLLGQMFNKMLSHLRVSIHKLEDANRNLEVLVAERTAELSDSNQILDRQAKRLEEIMGNQDGFYLRTAHELRTPLTLIRAPVEELISKEDNKEKLESLNIVRRACFRLHRLVDQMLQVATTGEAGKTGHQSVDLESLMVPIIDLYSKNAGYKSISFHVGPVPSAAVSLNKNIVVDVVNNLLSNALKYTPDGGNIRVGMTLEPGYLLFSVADDGVGIELGLKEKVFERSFRESDSVEGYGVGLYITKQLLDECGGSISVESTKGNGAQFLAKIPCTTTLEKRKNVPSIRFEENIYRRDGGQEAEKLYILVIEDDTDMQKVLKNALIKTYNVLVVGSVSEALRVVNEKDLALILCDIMLPDGSGFEIISEVKSNDDICHIPIIALTAIGDLPGQQKGWKIGTDDYIVKPFAVSELLLRVDGVIENRKRLQSWYKQKYLLNGSNMNETVSVSSPDQDYMLKLSEETLKLIKERRCRMDNLSKVMGQSNRTLQRKLNTHLGQTFTEYSQALKLKLAKDLLLKGYSVKETAFESDFTDSSYFSKSFKKQFGMTPSSFVKMKKDIKGEVLQD